MEDKHMLLLTMRHLAAVVNSKVAIVEVSIMEVSIVEDLLALYHLETLVLLIQEDLRTL